MTAGNDRPKLTMPKDEARRRLQERNEAAKDILPSDIHSHDDLTTAERREKGWRAFNDELLSRMFTAEEYRDDYNAAARRAHTVEDRYFPPSLQELVGRLSDSVQSQVARLHSLVERLDLIDELFPATNNHMVGSPMLQGKALIEEARKLGLAVGDLLTTDGQRVAYKVTKDFRATTSAVSGEWRSGDLIRDARIIEALQQGKCRDIVPLEYELQQRVAKAQSEQNRQPRHASDAIEAVYEAIRGLISAGKAAHSAEVPHTAVNILIQKRGGSINQAEASAEIDTAIKELKASGRIEIPPGPFGGWLIKGPPEMPSFNDKVFIVHGHDGEARESVARFIERLGLKPVILHEEANQGRTIIEKVEEHGNVGFAVVLLTADDVGRSRDGELQPRPRQNVLLELGYFIGRLGRARVCALKRGEMELPTDFAGVVWEAFDGQLGSWKLSLARELKAAGFEVDSSKILT